MSKVCTKCKQERPLSQFHKHRLSKDGLAHQCKECNEKRSKIWRRTPPGVFSQIQGRQLYLNRHNDSRSKPFNLEREEFIKWYIAQSKMCCYCGIPEENLGLIAKKYGSRWKRLTIDCKENSLGYEINNIVLACDKCNITKNNMLTYEEMLFVGKNFIRPKWKVLEKLCSR